MARLPTASSSTTRPCACRCSSTALASRAQVSESPVSLIDVAPTIARLVGLPPFDSDGVDLSPAFDGRPVPPRRLYAESFAPLLDFGWSPLRTRARGGMEIHRRAAAGAVPRRPGRRGERERRGGGGRPGCRRCASGSTATRAATLEAVGGRRPRSVGATAGARLCRRWRRRPEATRADPKDRRELAAAIAQITSGELHGEALERALRAVLAADPGNPQMNMRLGFVLADTGRCGSAIAYFEKAIARGMPGADPHLGLASCHALARRLGSRGDGAARRGSRRARQPRRPREPGDRPVGRRDVQPRRCPRSSARCHWIPTSTKRASTWRSPTRARAARGCGPRSRGASASPAGRCPAAARGPAAARRGERGQSAFVSGVSPFLVAPQRVNLFPSHSSSQIQDPG